MCERYWTLPLIEFRRPERQQDWRDVFRHDELDTSKNLCSNHGLIGSIGRVAQERRHGRSSLGAF
jgi:hypothetical protein